MDESITYLEALDNVDATFEYTCRNALAKVVRSFVDGRTFPGQKNEGPYNLVRNMS